MHKRICNYTYYFFLINHDMKNIHVAYYEPLVVKFILNFTQLFPKLENFPLVHNINAVKIELKLQSSNMMLTV